MRPCHVGDYYCPLCNTVYPEAHRRANVLVYFDEVAQQLCCGVCGHVVQIVTDARRDFIEVAELDEAAWASPAA